MVKTPTIITEHNFYATRGGRLVFIEKIEQAAPPSTIRALGYSISGTRAEAKKIWRVWSINGKVESESDPEWDIINAI